jgi:hypothetical protein
VHGNGGILTTVGDLLIWTQNLADGVVGGPEFVRNMHAQGQLLGGAEIRYAAGLMVQTFAGVPSVVHTGATAGYRAFLGRYPDQELTVAMLCNVTNVPTAESGGQIARIFLGDEAEDPVPPAGIDLPSGTLELFAGRYVEPVTGSIIDWYLDGDVLRAADGAMVPISETTFVNETGEDRIAFDVSDVGQRSGYSLESWQHRQRFEPVEPWYPAEPALAEFSGTYYSDDAETAFVVSVMDDELKLWRRPNQSMTLVPIYRDGFHADDNVVRFRRDASGNITGLSLSRSRVYDMEFERTGGP